MPSCDHSCELSADRRAFLRSVAAAAAGVFMGLGLSARGAAALPIARMAGHRVQGGVRYPIPTADGATIDTDQQVILVRFKGVVYAFALSCPHQNTALKWLAEEGRFQCPKHKSKYQPDGTFISGRATRNMDRLPLRRDGASVVVDVDHVFESDKDPKEWAGALVRL